MVKWWEQISAEKNYKKVFKKNMLEKIININVVKINL